MFNGQNSHRLNNTGSTDHVFNSNLLAATYSVLETHASYPSQSCNFFVYDELITNVVQFKPRTVVPVLNISYWNIFVISGLKYGRKQLKEQFHV